MVTVSKDINGLINQKKYKKALQQLGKQKTKDYFHYHHKAICHSKLKQYSQALIAFKDALKLASNNKKVPLLNDIAMVALLSEDKKQAQRYYLKSLECDASANNAFACEQYVMLSLSLDEHDEVLNYAPKLTVLKNHAVKGFMALIRSCLALNKRDLLHSYISKIAQSCVDFTPQQLASILNLLLANQQNKEYKILLDSLNKHSPNATWLQDFNDLSETESITPSAKEKQTPKSLVTGDDSELIALINELVDFSKEQGAFFNPELEIKVTNGELGVFYYGSKAEKLIDIPIICMPLMCDFEVELEGDSLVLKQKERMINPLAMTTMKLLTAIYNQGHKITKWKDSSPFLSLYDSPELLLKLLEPKQYNTKVKKFKALFEAKEKKALIIESFFGSRVFGYRKELLLNNNIKTDKNIEQGLLSIIDFLNHKPNSNNYKSSNNSLYVSGRADKQTDEVFVQYNEFDPVLTYLFYGFVDLSTTFLTSVSAELTTTYGQKWLLLGHSTASSKLKEGSFSHNQSHLPAVTHLPNGSITLNKLLVPTSQGSTLLKETLLNVINTAAPDNIVKNDAFFTNEIAHIEKQLMLVNLKYWQELKVLTEQDELSSDNAKAPLFDLINHSLKTLKNYANQNSIALF